MHEVKPVWIVVALTVGWGGSGSSQPVELNEGLSRLGSHFEKNLGQLPRAVDFCYRTKGFRFDLSGSGIRVAVIDEMEPGGEPIGLCYDGAGAEPRLKGVDKLPFTVMHRVAVDESRRHMTSIPTYAGVVMESVYPGIDVCYRIVDQQVEFDFLVAPGADPGQIRFGLPGVREAVLTPDGDLHLRFPGITLCQHLPAVYQDIDGHRVPVTARYVLTDAGQAGIALGEYHRGFDLVIDPLLRVEDRVP